MSDPVPDNLFDRWDAICGLDLPGELVHTLVEILRFQNTAESCWVKTKTLAARLKVDVRSVNRRLASLSRLGIEVRHGDGFCIDFESLCRWERPVVTNVKRTPTSRNRTPTSTPPLDAHVQGLDAHVQALGRPRPSVPLKGKTIERPLENIRVREEPDKSVQKQKFVPGKFPLPSEIDTPEIRAEWEAWHRARRVKATEEACRRAALALARAGPDAALKALDASVRNGWTGVFPERFTNDHQINGHSRKTDGAIYDPNRKRGSRKF